MTLEEYEKRLGELAGEELQKFNNDFGGGQKTIEQRVREFVDKIISTRAADRQFDQCNLTLKDLDTIAEVVTKSIVGTLHRRVAYPDQSPEKPAANVIPMSGGSDS